MEAPSPAPGRCGALASLGGEPRGRERAVMQLPPNAAIVLVSCEAPVCLWGTDDGPVIS